MRGIYQMQDLDFNLSQFGIFLNNNWKWCLRLLDLKLMKFMVIFIKHDGQQTRI
jgi:hypothetical protein